MIITRIYFRFITVLIILVGTIDIYSQDTSQLKLQEKVNNSFSSFKNSQQQNFKDFKINQQKAFDDFKKEIQRKWGEQNFLSSDSVTWVEYQEGNETRSSVNFKEGTATVEVILDARDAQNKEVIDDKLMAAIEILATSKGKVDDFNFETDDGNELFNEPILENQLIDENGNKIDESNIEEFAKEVVHENRIKTWEADGTDGEKRVILSLSIPLAPDYLKVRAEKLLPIVTKYANIYGIEPELILGIIHVESYFNPKAISHANAVGLMQLVPSSGGLDAYEYIFGECAEPSQEYLFNPENNIQLGTAYLQKMKDVYFKDLVDSENKLYCIIASYNTGVGNLCYAVTNTTFINPAVEELNKMEPEYTFDFLSQNLQYQEARAYLINVHEKYLMYQYWIDYK